jgi:peptidoglycan/LPS O-acetylase OafA/YrhL
MRLYFPELDGLRGVAALTVFLSHAIAIVAPSPAIDYLQHSPFRALWDGAAAVDFFFVLSGFVLTLPYLAGGKELNYYGYLIRRFFRLYPAYWLALAISMVLRVAYSPGAMSGFSEWALSLWKDPVTFGALAAHSTLLLRINTHAIDPVIWSLAIEVKMTLILPAFIYLLRRVNSGRVQVLLLLGSLMLGAATDKLMFFPHFAFGAYLAANHVRLSSKLAGLSRGRLIAMLVVAFVLYGNRWVFQSGAGERTCGYLTAAASALIILLVTTISISRSSRLFGVSEFLGQASYSFYLLHLPILLTIISILYPISHSLMLCLLVAVAVTFGIAIVIYRSVECNGIQLGRRVANGAPLRIL